MRNTLVIIGAGGHGKVLADIAKLLDKWDSILFLDDNQENKSVAGINVAGKLSNISVYKENADFIVAIGNNKIREKIQFDLMTHNYSITTLIHPSAIIAQDVKIGLGSVIMAGSVINSSSSIGNGCIINTSSSVDHDSTIGDYVHLSPGVRVAGTVGIGRRSWLGIGSVVSNNINICPDCLIGAGAVVIQNIDISGKYVGLPASKID